MADHNGGSPLPTRSNTAPGDYAPYHDIPEESLFANESRHHHSEHGSHWDQPASARKQRGRSWPVLMVAAIIALALFITTKVQNAPEGFESVGYMACPRDRDMECGFISVPRNYFNESEGQTYIAVTRYRATDRKRRIGTLFINAGGPGGSGVNLMFIFGKLLSRLLEGRYDIVGFDPRGVGATLPAMSCFPSYRDAQTFRHGTVLQQGFNLPPGDPSTPENRRSILTQMRDWLALNKAQSQMCLNAPEADDLPHMSTTTVARDIDYMTTTLDGQDALIYFWGPSYGSVIGSYLINMFPERVGRVAIDGVVDPWEWSNAPAHMWLNTQMNATEAAFDYILEKCGETGPTHCALASKKGESGEAISWRIDRYLDRLYHEPISYAGANLSGIITSGMVRALLYRSTNAPLHFSRIAAAISDARRGLPDELATLTLSPFHNVDTPRPGDNVRNIVACLDAPPYQADRPHTWPTEEELTLIAIDRLNRISPRFGISVSLFEADGACQFLAKAAAQLPERFAGPFNKTLRSPILVFSADLDPITPLVSARWVNNQLGDSARLVIQKDSPAHSTLFLGEVPLDKETFCANEVQLFPSVATTDGGDEDPDFASLVRQIQEVMGLYFPPGLP